MTTAVVSPYFDFGDVINKNNKMLNYNNNILGTPNSMSLPCTGASPSISNPTGTLLDRKAVGTPSVGGMYQRRHSVTLPSSKFNQNQFLKMDQPLPTSSNKENRFRDRSFSETGERLLQKCTSSPGGSSSTQVNSSRYKTELCRPFEENGTCKYGDKCQFAHGIHELRNLSRHPKYKTELCRTFHTIGFCPYGPRCHFIHNADERRGPPPLSASNKLERPRLQHSYSFAGFSSAGGSQDSPTSVTPPPIFSGEDLDWPSNPFTYSSQELANLFGPSLGAPASVEPPTPGPPSPSTPYYFRPLSDSPPLFEPPPSPPNSLSDQEGYQSSSGSLSGSESPILDTTRRLPIFSRLSISDD
ncbi:mRNA decay activator protein ZFP36L1a isoform X1 [Paramormyrops kingsleyae]|uniref:mRNA decay activator protein ZFP36 n=2 Tax=Paramormyrops kingsleyae TaxID=1676925 RepID=A0A3B3SAE3_9TELE|nr:mRNA decay activator protein ZFP36L1-like isoform X1 [Paramormyrops kingsleyae]